MALHIGSSPAMKVYIQNLCYKAKMATTINNLTEPVLAASDGTIIKDVDGKYLILEGEN